MSRQFRSSALDKVRLHLLGGAASALWATTWADAMEAAGRSRELSGNEITEIMPPIPRVMRNLSIALVYRVEAMNEVALEELLDINRWTNDAKDFGHYLAMESLGHGVSWSDDHMDHGLKLPHVEVHMSDPEDVGTINWSGFSRANPCRENPLYGGCDDTFLPDATWMIASDRTRDREFRQHSVTVVSNDGAAIAELRANGYAFRHQKGGRYAEFIKRIPVGAKKNPAWTNRTFGKKLRVPYASPFGNGEKEFGGVVGDYDNVAEEFIDQVKNWMYENHLEMDTYWYTRDQWRKRKFNYGNDAVITLTAEGAFNHLMNYAQGGEDDDLIADFNNLIDAYDLYYDQGHAWTFHFYPNAEHTIWDDYLKAIGP